MQLILLKANSTVNQENAPSASMMMDLIIVDRGVVAYNQQPSALHHSETLLPRNAKSEKQKSTANHLVIGY